MKIKIKVTKEILKESMHCSNDGLSSNCAVALAVREIFPCASVGTWGIYLDDCEINLTDAATSFIRKFDESTPLERSNLPPLSFTIEVSDSVINGIGISQVYKILSESKTLEYVG